VDKIMNKTYVIQYEVHCKFQNFFNKEIIVKNCISVIHAKSKLDDYCKNKYDEYQYIIVKSCLEKFPGFENIFGKGFGNVSDIFGGKK
jgi:hypothetical protein